MGVFKKLVERVAPVRSEKITEEEARIWMATKAAEKAFKKTKGFQSEFGRQEAFNRHMDERIRDIRVAIAENEQRLKEQAANATAAYQEDKTEVMSIDAQLEVLDGLFKGHHRPSGQSNVVDTSLLSEAFELLDEAEGQWRERNGDTESPTKACADAAVQQFSESADKASAMSKAFKKAAAAAKAKKDGGVDKPTDHSL